MKTAIDIFPPSAEVPKLDERASPVLVNGSYIIVLNQLLLYNTG